MEGLSDEQVKMMTAYGMMLDSKLDAEQTKVHSRFTALEESLEFESSERKAESKLMKEKFDEISDRLQQLEKRKDERSNDQGSTESGKSSSDKGRENANRPKGKGVGKGGNDWEGGWNDNSNEEWKPTCLIVGGFGCNTHRNDMGPAITLAKGLLRDEERSKMVSAWAPFRRGSVVKMRFLSHEDAKVVGDNIAQGLMENPTPAPGSNGWVFVALERNPKGGAKRKVMKTTM